MSAIPLFKELTNFSAVYFSSVSSFFDLSWSGFLGLQKPHDFAQLGFMYLTDLMQCLPRLSAAHLGQLEFLSTQVTPTGLRAATIESFMTARAAKIAKAVFMVFVFVCLIK
jgi:hypothetical protein